MFQMACTDLHNLRIQPQQPGQGDDGQRGRGHHRQATLTLAVRSKILNPVGSSVLNV